MAYNVRLANEDDFAIIYQMNREFADFIQRPEKFKITLEQMRSEQEFFQGIGPGKKRSTNHWICHNFYCLVLLAWEISIFG